MKRIQHNLSIAAPVRRVYDAIATAVSISTWWDKQTPVQTDQGLVLEHSPGVQHGVVRLRVVALVPDHRVEWECISIHPATSPASAWTGTHFVFELAAQSAASISLRFQQTGYDETSPYFDGKLQAWAQVLQNLKRVVESQARR
jgi:uncharacterized protein YndB with AHSA1/START domain